MRSNISKLKLYQQMLPAPDLGPPSPPPQPPPVLTAHPGEQSLRKVAGGLEEALMGSHNHQEAQWASPRLQARSAPLGSTCPSIHFGLWRERPCSVLIFDYSLKVDHSAEYLLGAE